LIGIFCHDTQDRQKRIQPQVIDAPLHNFLYELSVTTQVEWFTSLNLKHIIFFLKIHTNSLKKVVQDTLLNIVLAYWLDGYVLCGLIWHTKKTDIGGTPISSGSSEQLLDDLSVAVHK
jgi:hypothetical protein